MNISEIEAELREATAKELAARESYFRALAEYTKKCEAIGTEKDRICHEWIDATNNRHALQMMVARLKSETN